ncbi:PREDICTED: phosphatidate phosphatase LPIN1, partial [Galeopterus variegatus]|uniref:Phosphatidate phosphatase LPIN1 n=1 Tax=Galeopterus variegatus TaxID=482537 RepID=A0ABM0RTN5_GALVR
MNYVGQLAGQVFVTVKELYKGLNPATLSGCIDIIVVRQPNGNLQCSPFHVRFGKMGVLRSREKVVDIAINGESVDLHMKLGDNGEAFFVQEADNDQEVIPMYLATSPILSEGATRMECQLKRNSLDRIRSLDTNMPAQVIPPSEAPSSGSLGKKRRKRRRKSQLDSLKKDDNINTSEDEDMFPIEMSSDEDMEPLDSSRTLPDDIPPFQDDVPMENLSSVSSYPQSASYPNSDREWSPNPSSLVDCKRNPPHLAAAARGGLSSSCPPQSAHFHASERKPVVTGFFSDVSLEKEWVQVTVSTSPHKMKDSSPLNSRNTCEKIHFQAIHSESSDTCSDQSPTLAGGPLLDQNKSQMEMQFVSEEDMEALGATAPPLPMIEELKAPSAGVMQTANKTDSPSRRKDKRSRHLGADGVYLDDLTDMDPEVAALYFPKNGDPLGLAKHASDSGARSANQSPQSMGSSGVDSGVESTSDGLRDLPSIGISLCGGLGDNREITRDAFLEQAVSYQQFVDNPAIIDDPNLVVKIGNKYYNWTTAAPLLLAMQAFQKPLPKESKPEQCLAGKGHSTGEQPSQLGVATRIKHESSSSDDEHAAAKPTNAGHLPLLSNVSYRKTLRLTSEQL